MLHQSRRKQGGHHVGRLVEHKTSHVALDRRTRSSIMHLIRATQIAALACFLLLCGTSLGPATASAAPYTVILKNTSSQILWGGYITTNPSSPWVETPNETWYVYEGGVQLDATPGSTVNFWVSRPPTPAAGCDAYAAERVDRSGPIAVFFPFGSSIAEMAVPNLFTSLPLDISAEELKFVGLMNAERVAAGHGPLRINRYLSMAADLQADFISKRWVITHCGYNASSVDERVRGVSGPSASPAEAVGLFTVGSSAETWYNTFLNSPLHHAIYAGQEKTHVGVAFRDGAVVMVLADCPECSDDFGVGTVPIETAPPIATEPLPNENNLVSKFVPKMNVVAYSTGYLCRKVKGSRYYVCNMQVRGRLTRPNGAGMAAPLGLTFYRGYPSAKGAILSKRSIRSNAAGNFAYNEKVAMPMTITTQPRAAAAMQARFGKAVNVRFAGTDSYLAAANTVTMKGL